MSLVVGMFLLSDSFLEAVSRELELIEKKKRVFDGLFQTGKISYATYKALCGAVESSIAKIRMFVEEAVSEVRRLREQALRMRIFRERMEVLHAFGELDDYSYLNLDEALNLAMNISWRKAEKLEETLSRLNLLEREPAKAEASREEPGWRVEALVQEVPVMVLHNGGTRLQDEASTAGKLLKFKWRLKIILRGLKRCGCSFKAVIRSLVRGLSRTVVRFHG